MIENVQYTNDIVSTTFKCPEMLRKALKLYSVHNDKAMNDILLEAVVEYMTNKGYWPYEKVRRTLPSAERQ